MKDLLYKVEKPARYAGGEFNLPDMDKPRKLSVCLAFPDVYEVAMSNLGLRILYGILNDKRDVVCERVFAPWTDMGKLLKETERPLFSIETFKPIKDFDMLGFSLQYELSYTNIIYMLDLANIPYYAKDRDADYPILVAGGPCTANPEPFAAFFDIICIGDGEEFISELADIMIKYKGDKDKILAEAAKLQGGYVPSLSVETGGVNVSGVKKAVVKSLDGAYVPLKPLVPNIDIVHDRPVAELFRGCYAGCRFCQACFFYRPIRVRSAESVTETVKSLICSTGTEEVGLSSLSSGDYPYIREVIKEIADYATSKNVKLQLPSLRLDSYTKELTQNTRRSSLTFAPEAGTQRLRNVINKNISDSDIEKTMREAFAEGYSSVKLYFMVGLPTETDDDLKGIASVVRKIKEIHYGTGARRALNISVSTSVFVPKPLTPFQWTEQITAAEMKRRQQLVRNELRTIKGVNYSWHEEELSFLECVFARGGRELSKLVVAAYENGCYFDGWSEFFKFPLWKEAAEKVGINPDKYSEAVPTDAALPWDFIDFGVRKDYLLAEFHKAAESETSESCKEGCRACGANVYGECKIQKA